MPFEIVRNDITKMKVDAIVCSGNQRLEKAEGLCGVVFAAAGPRLEKHCASLPGCDTGAAVVTPGFDLPAKYVIHTVGPHWNGGQNGETEILRTCFKNVLKAARMNLCKSVAIPLIASGRYRFPKELAMRIAKEEIDRFLESNPGMTVYLVVYSPEATKLGMAMQADLREYITNEEYRQVYEAYGSRLSRTRDKLLPTSLKDATNATGPSFRDLLFHYVEASGESWPAIYNRVGIQKAVVSKLKNNPDYCPSKRTALAFAISLRLSLRQTEDLLKSFGASFSPSDTADNIVRYFILSGEYDIYTIDDALYDYGEKPFCGDEM